MEGENLFDQALTAARQGDLATARTVLKQLLKQEPQNINAWLLGAQVVETNLDAIRCYERILKIDPNHAYAKQKLAELRPMMPDVQEIIVPPTNRSIPVQPVLYQPDEEIALAKSKAEKARRDITIALSGLGVLLCCLAGLLVVALPRMGFLQVAQTTPPSNQELYNVLYSNSRAANDENIDAYMATIHPSSPAVFTTRSALQLIFSKYDLRFYFYNLSVRSVSGDEAKIHFSLQTEKIRGPDFRNNIVTGTMILRSDHGVWKIYSQEVENTTYK